MAEDRRISRCEEDDIKKVRSSPDKNISLREINRDEILQDFRSKK
jgi:hypothetical protein